MVRELAYRLRVPLFNRQKPELYFRHAFVTRAGDEAIRLDVLEIDVASLHEWSLRFEPRRPFPFQTMDSAPSIASGAIVRLSVSAVLQNARLLRLSRCKRFRTHAHNLQDHIGVLGAVVVQHSKA